MIRIKRYGAVALAAGLTLWLGAAFSQDLPADIQPAGTDYSDPHTDQLEERAQRVQEKYPWLIQEANGLVVFAVNISRDEFLHGLRAATDLVFDGTAELPEMVTIRGFFPDVSAVIRKLGESNPALRQEIDLKSKNVRFSRSAPVGKGLSEQDFIARYRRGRLANATAANGAGAYLSGNLIIDGTLVPSPIQIEVAPMRDLSEIQILANTLVVARFRYTDLFSLDQDLYQADTPEKFEKALIEKTGRIWLQVSQIPFAATDERFTLTAGQLRGIYGVADVTLGGDRLTIKTLEGKSFDWRPSQAAKNAPLSEPEAFQKAYETQNQIFGGLASGGVVFCSHLFGIRVIPQGYFFMEELRRIAGDSTLSIQDKVQAIQDKWPGEVDPILEFLFTTLLDGTVQSPQSQIPGFPTAPPLPTPAIPGEGLGGRPPEEVLKELLQRQR
ncbi:MAG: hypothetical protein UZ16_OP3001001834 [Candidatus Hinthialibacteria bacterium OLB16]|nr:MAG: hypothetical protein UZ16_OP3001001834 [Candidatus Hinthialibacteria bacterium OLB16]